MLPKERTRCKLQKEETVKQKQLTNTPIKQPDTNLDSKLHPISQGMSVHVCVCVSVFSPWPDTVGVSHKEPSWSD